VIPLLVLVIVTLLTRLAGRLATPSLDSWPAAVRVGLAAMFCFTAAAHFNSMRADLIAMVPPGVPAPGLLVTLTGIAEVLGGLGLLFRATRRPAAIGLILLLVAVLPANVHAALASIPFRGGAPTPLVPRVALQAAFVFLVWWSSLRGRSRRAFGGPDTFRRPHRQEC
jgi:uncharacterized membrane protein